MYLKSRNKPPLVLYFMAVLAIGGFAFTFFRPETPSIRASKETVIYHSIGNVSTHQAGVYYQTTNATKSWIVYGESENNLDHAAFDERDTEDNKLNYNLHFVLLKDLQENTRYNYKIIADGEVVSVNGVQTFTFTTPKTAIITNSTSINPAYGKVLQPNNDPVNDGFVLYYFPGAYPLISPIKGGDWLIALNSLVDRDTGKPLTPKPTDTVKIQIIDEQLRSTVIETLLGNTTPLSKTVIIGTNYAQDKDDGVLSAHIEISITPDQPAPTTVVKPSFPKSQIEITFPKEDAIVPGNNPLIKGKAVPNSQLSIVLRSTKQTIYTTKVSADAAGEWKVSLPMPLQPLKHVLTVTTKDAANKIVALSRTFTTTKSGEEVVLGEATGSGTITPVVPTATPTQVIAEVSPTLALTTPTAVITPTPIAVTTPPVTGDNTVLIMLGSLALVIVAAGVILIL
ncbi:MAG: fibronectin type III domain-containing protein [Patescibacteria group bacterium]